MGVFGFVVCFFFLCVFFVGGVGGFGVWVFFFVVFVLEVSCHSLKRRACSEERSML